MHRFEFRQLSDGAVLQGMKSFRGRERLAVAHLVGLVAEADERRLYLGEACDSMLTFCERELGLSYDESLKRIQAGRVARRFPRVFGMLADGRLHLTALNLLARHLTEANADALLGAASNRSKRDIERMLKERFPGTEPLPLVATTPAHAPEHVRVASIAPVAMPVSAAGAPEAAPAPAPPPARTRVAPHAGGRYTLQLALDQAAYDALRECEALLGHSDPSAGPGAVVARAIHELATKLRKRRFAITARPAQRRRPSADTRRVPASVRRAVYARDGGCCTFVSDDGRRCGSRRRLELDHIVPVARGGGSTVDNVRLRCRAHNQYAAERVFGAAFMAARRGAARDAATVRARAPS